MSKRLGPRGSNCHPRRRFPRHTGSAPVNGVRIWYAVFGKGKWVILLHGGLNNSNYWGNQVRVQGHLLIERGGSLIHREIRVGRFQKLGQGYRILGRCLESCIMSISWQPDPTGFVFLRPTAGFQ